MRAKRDVQDQDVRKRLAHAATLHTQGKLFELSDVKSSFAWSKTIQTASSAHLNFAQNAATDTLPHNANLALWRKRCGITDKCKLCGERQTLPHILNCCQVALADRRYNQRHDGVVEVIAGFLERESVMKTSL